MDRLSEKEKYNVLKMGNQGSNFRISEHSEDHLIITWIPDRREIIFIRGKRAQTSEIISDRDFFYYTLFRILDLYTWRYMNRKSLKVSTSTPLLLQRKASIPSMKSSLSTGSVSPSLQQSSDESGSPRLLAIDKIVNDVTEIREKSPSPTEKRGSPRSEYPVYYDNNKYISPLRDEIIEASIKIIRQYLEDEDAGLCLLSINQYLSNLSLDNFPYFLNFRPNYECSLAIELCYRLNFYQGWLLLPQSHLHPHEWKFLIDQGILLFSHLCLGPRQALGDSSSPRYLDLLIETEKKIENGKIRMNPALPCYSEIDLLENFRISADDQMENLNILRPYFQKVLCHIENDKNLVAQTVLKWHATFFCSKS